MCPHSRFFANSIYFPGLHLHESCMIHGNTTAHPYTVHTSALPQIGFTHLGMCTPHEHTTATTQHRLSHCTWMETCSISTGGSRPQGL